MVEQLIVKYLEVGGQKPFGLAYGRGVDEFWPEHILAAYVPGLKDGAVVVMPLQTLVDVTNNALWGVDEDDDE